MEATGTATKTATATDVKDFTVTVNNFKFDMAQIRVNRGDTVKINFINSQGMHVWVVNEFNVRTKVLQAGQSESITFVANQAGTFEYYCSLGQHRQMGMKGNLIVK